MARKFLYVVAGMIVLVLAGLLALRLFADDLTRFVAVPQERFTPQPRLATNAYADAAMWISRPDKPVGQQAAKPAPTPASTEAAAQVAEPAGDPARFLPTGVQRGAPLDAAVFFIHPTSFLGRDHWNAPDDDAVSGSRAVLFVRGMASPFGDAAEIWAPRYRQAAFGAFLSDRPDAREALDLAYGDVLDAFDWFIAHAGKDASGRDRPIVLVGHSQGAMHLLRLLKERVAGTPLARRVVAAYVIGWPVSATHDLPLTGLTACTGPAQSGCVMSWASFAEPAVPPVFKPGYAGAIGLDGKQRLDAPLLCTNPLTGGAPGPAAAKANLGTLLPAADLESARLAVGMVPAHCDARGLLLIGDPPDLGPYVLPGNNYHLYDIPLFWANLRADVAARVGAWRVGAWRASH